MKTKKGVTEKLEGLSGRRNHMPQSKTARENGTLGDQPKRSVWCE